MSGRDRNVNQMYQYGTAVRSVMPEYSPSYNPAPEYEQQPLRRPNVRTYPTVDWAFRLQMGFGLMVLFVASLSFVHLCANLSARQSELKYLHNELREVKSTVNNLEASIAASLNLDKIQEQAKQQLGMAEPLPHQVIYIELPKESYTKYNE